MPAKARILVEAVAGGNVTGMMPEQSAQVAHLLFERRRRRIRIALGVEQQRVAALCAHVFVAAVAIGELLVSVLAEKA